MVKPLLNYKSNREVIKGLRRGGAHTEALVLPELEGRDLVLRYVRGKLNDKLLSEKELKIVVANSITHDLYEQYERWGGVRPKEIEVHCKVASKKLVACKVTTSDGDYHSSIMNLNLLHGRRFQTILPITRWLNFKNAASSRIAESMLEDHLREVNEVIAGTRRSIWNPQLPEQKSFDWSKFDPVKQLIVEDAIGFVPTAQDSVVASVYKAF